MHWF